MHEAAQESNKYHSFLGSLFLVGTHQQKTTNMVQTDTVAPNQHDASFSYFL